MLQSLRLTAAPFLVLLALMSGYSLQQTQATSPSPTPTPSLPTNEEVAPTQKAASPSVFSEDTKIVEKSLPVLGTTYIQLDFEAKDAEAFLNGTPRPTTPETLAVLAGNPPPGADVCNLPYSAITIAIYQECIHEGLSYVEVSNTVGWAGKEASSSGSTVEYTWGNGDKGVMSAMFQDNRLISKSQVGLK